MIKEVAIWIWTEAGITVSPYTHAIFTVCPVVRGAFVILSFPLSGTNSSQAKVEWKLGKERLTLW